MNISINIIVNKFFIYSYTFKWTPTPKIGTFMEF